LEELSKRSAREVLDDHLNIANRTIHYTVQQKRQAG